MNKQLVARTRESINGLRKQPTGFQMPERYKTLDEALKSANRLKSTYKSARFSVSPATGNEYCILRYGAKLRVDLGYINI